MKGIWLVVVALGISILNVASMVMYVADGVPAVLVPIAIGFNIVLHVGIVMLLSRWAAKAGMVMIVIGALISLPIGVLVIYMARKVRDQQMRDAFYQS